MSYILTSLPDSTLFGISHKNIWVLLTGVFDEHHIFFCSNKPRILNDFIYSKIICALTIYSLKFANIEVNLTLSRLFTRSWSTIKLRWIFKQIYSCPVCLNCRSNISTILFVFDHVCSRCSLFVENSTLTQEEYENFGIKKNRIFS